MNRRRTDSQSVSGNQHRTRPQRKERESNSQGTRERTRPASNRFPSPIGLPFRLPQQAACLPSSPTRIRTRNTSLEARDDFRFTIGPCQSGRHEIRTHTPVKAHALAVRSGQPYPATFRIEWSHRESNPDCQHAMLESSRWTMTPLSSSGPPGSRTPITWLQARRLPIGRAARVVFSSRGPPGN